MKRLLGLLLVMGIVGCGEEGAELEELGAVIDRNEQGEVIRVTDSVGIGTDSVLIQLKGLSKLQELDLLMSRVTDGGLVHLKGRTNRVKLAEKDLKQHQK